MTLLAKFAGCGLCKPVCSRMINSSPRTGAEKVVMDLLTLTYRVLSEHLPQGENQGLQLFS